MHKPNMYLAVLLTVHNRRAKTLACLSHLFSQALPDGIIMDVWLTDDGCSDGTTEAVLETYPQVKIVQGDGNLFWNRGMYRAWEAASNNKKYDYYVWLNDDTFIYADCLKSLISASSCFENQAIIVGATVDTTTHTRPTYGGRVENGDIAPLGGGLTSIVQFNGNIVLVPTYVFQKLGNLDYYYTHSKGDIDYGIRAKKVGIAMYQVGEALGECDSHDHIDRWCDPQVPIKTRLSLLNKPTGMPPMEIFHLEKQINILVAAIHYITIYVRCIFPKIWELKS